MEYSPLSHISFAFAELKAGKEAGSLTPIFSGPPTEADTRRAHHMAEQLQKMEPDVQRRLFMLLGMRASTIPWRAIHPSWLIYLMRSWPAQWRLWALETLPQETRARAQKSSPTTVTILNGRTPAWWPMWLSECAKNKFKYPEVSPWKKGPTESDLPSSLWEFDDSDVITLLRAHGTFGIVSCMRKLPRADAQQLMWQLPEDIQSVAADIVKMKKWVDDSFWLIIYEEMRTAHPVLQDLLLWIGLSDWLRCGIQDLQAVNFKRLAYRLPRTLGRWILQKIDTPPTWAALPVLPSIEGWKKQLKELIRDLRKKGRIRYERPSSGASKS